MTLISRLRRYYTLKTIKTTRAPLSTEEHILSALQWFDSSLQNEGGSSAKYNLYDHAYFPSYPETTGYWINTLFLVSDYYLTIYKNVFKERNVPKELANWLLSIQRRDGTFPGSYGDYNNQPPRVFNTGQIILGLMEYYKRTHDENVLNGIIKSADWLLSVQSEKGYWDQYSKTMIAGNTRTACALIKLYNLTQQEKYLHAGVKNIEFSLTLQSSNGYFTKSGMEPYLTDITHTIAYTMHGFLEAGIELKNEKWIKAVEKSYIPLISMIDESGFLPGQIDENFKSPYTYCCLTGNCQLAIIGFILFRLLHVNKYRESAVKLLKYVKSRQLKSRDKKVNGGITGSWPINGNYNPYEIPNWPAKFFIDALILEQNNDIHLTS